MKLSSLLSPAQITVGIEADCLADAIPEMVGHLRPAEVGGRVDEIVEAVLRRESQSATAMQNGIAIPHARVEGLDDYCLLLAVCKEPLSDLGLDGKPVDLVFLIAASSQKHTVMLQTMAAIAALARDTDRLDRVRAAGDADDAWEEVDSGGYQVKKGLFARDLMVEPPFVAREDMPMGELLDGFSRHQVYNVPVCREDGTVVGGVGTREVLEAGFPEYLSRMRDIAFLTEFEPFEEFFKRETTTRVADIMSPKPLLVEAEDPMIQVVFKLKTEGRRVAFVQDGGRLAGVIVCDDIISKILRA